MALVLKTGRAAMSSWVRIPHPPPRWAAKSPLTSERRSGGVSMGGGSVPLGAAVSHWLCRLRVGVPGPFSAAPGSSVPNAPSIRFRAASCWRYIVSDVYTARRLHSPHPLTSVGASGWSGMDTLLPQVGPVDQSSFRGGSSALPMWCGAARRIVMSESCIRSRWTLPSPQGHGGGR